VERTLYVIVLLLIDILAMFVNSMRKKKHCRKCVILIMCIPK